MSRSFLSPLDGGEAIVTFSEILIMGISIGILITIAVVMYRAIKDEKDEWKEW